MCMQASTGTTKVFCLLLGATHATLLAWWTDSMVASWLQHGITCQVDVGRVCFATMLLNVCGHPQCMQAKTTSGNRPCWHMLACICVALCRQDQYCRAPLNMQCQALGALFVFDDMHRCGAEHAGGTCA